MQHRKQKLDFAIIGAQKCATTWIYECLLDHPQLCLRDSKIEDYYYGGEMYKKNGGDAWYFKQFNNDATNRLKGCVSVEYIEDQNAHNTLFSHNPNIKLIASLRDPVDRAISAYQWYVRKALIPDLSLEKGMHEVIRHYKGEVNNQLTPLYKDIITRGYYANKLQPFVSTFRKEQLKIIFFEDVKENPLASIQSIMSFLCVSLLTPSKLNTAPKKNSGFDALIKLQRQFPRSKVIARLTDLSNQMLFKSMQTNPAIQKLSVSIKDDLRDLYKISITQLETLCDKIDPALKNKIHLNWNGQ